MDKKKKICIEICMKKKILGIMQRKMSHDTTEILRVEDPSKGFRWVIWRIDDATNMYHLDNILIFPIVYTEIMSFNVMCLISRTSCITNIDIGFILFIDLFWTQGRIAKTVEKMSKEETGFYCRNRSIESSFSRAKSSDWLCLRTVSYSTTREHDGITSSRTPFVKIIGIGSID